MQSFEHLITTRPHDIRVVFVSDLHLSSRTPALTDAFLVLVQDLCRLPHLQSLYILGDWLDAWIGDDDYLHLCDGDKRTHWLTPILEALAQLSAHANIYVMRGNRDFMLTQSLCDAFDGRLISEPYFIKLGQLCYRLEHGDALCTDDKAYQRYKTIIQNPVIAWLLHKQPLSTRRRLANNLKAKSTDHKHHKTSVIMDANPNAIAKALKHCDTLIHGHTHRPYAHHSTDGTRLVLGDWRYDGRHTQAVIATYDGTDVRLCQFVHGDMA